ncbi:hypothetical protein AgCh_005569 [Apium graveolens]
MYYILVTVLYFIPCVYVCNVYVCKESSWSELERFASEFNVDDSSPDSKGPEIGSSEHDGPEAYAQGLNWKPIAKTI